MKELASMKVEALGVLEQVAALADEVGAHSLSSTLRTERIPRLRDERFHLVVLGEFNHGKSTLINALLGADVLPVGVTPTTALVHRVGFGPEPHAELIGIDGAPESISLTELGSVAVSAKPDSRLDRQLSCVALDYPSPFLEGGVVLIDTPGVNDLNEARSEVTYGYLSGADAILFVLDASQILKESERRFIEERLLRQSRERLFFVVNKIDVLDDAEREEALAYAKTHLSRLIPNPRIWALSAERARARDIAGDVDTDSLERFVADLSEFLSAERAHWLIVGALDAAEGIAERLRAAIEIQRRAIAMEKNELDRRLALLEADLEASYERRSLREKKVLESIADLKAIVRHDSDGFAKRFAAAIAQDIEESDAKDLRKYLSGFIEEKFREFADEQVEMVARRLEKIAEEAVSFVAEDAEERRRSFSEALGPAAASELDLRVDTFAYDVGVFAVGAFGVTLMVLSNVVLGGAMALAAPVLAYALRGKTEARVKEHALREAPRVIVEIGDRLADGFDERIDEVGARLVAFTRQIDREMSRAVADLVRAARSAKLAGEQAQRELTEVAGKTLERIGDLTTSLGQLRKRLTQG